MKQRVISLMLTVAMGATLLAGCGSSATDSANAGADSGKESAATAGTESDEKDFSGEGKVINISSCPRRIMYLNIPIRMRMLLCL